MIARLTTLTALWDSAKAHQNKRAEILPDERACTGVIFDGFQRLKELGWREPMYAPKGGIALEVIEAGSTGIHFATRDEEGRFWIHDDDSWPSRPILFRLKATQEGE